MKLSNSDVNFSNYPKTSGPVLHININSHGVPWLVVLNVGIAQGFSPCDLTRNSRGEISHLKPICPSQRPADTPKYPGWNSVIEN